MGILIAGLRGGLVEDPSKKGPDHIVQKLLSGDLTSAELRGFLSSPQPRTLTMVVNNSCNLSCRHCYLQVDQLTAPALTVEEWQRVTDSICDSGVQLVCLSGKEVFLGKTGPQVLSMLADTRKQHRGFFRLGAITNGTLLGLHRRRLQESEMSYLDVSLDGLRAAHDSVRGAGAFSRTEENLKWLAPEFGSRLFAMVTLLSENFRQVPEVVTEMHRIGFQNVGFGFYRPQSYTDHSLNLNEGESESVFDHLHELAELELDRPMSVLFDMDCHMLDQLLPFLRSPWFDPTKVKVDRMGEVFVSHLLANGVTLNFRFTPYPTGIWRSARLNSDGSYLASEDTVDAKQYNRKAIANIRDFDFNLEGMNRFAMQSPRVQEILEDYETRILPLLVEASGSRLREASAEQLLTLA